MAEKFATVAPALFLSSQQLGWEGLLVEAFHEPDTFEGVLEPASPLPYIPLVLLRGNSMYIEQRAPNGPWRGSMIHADEMMLASNENTSGELRWQSVDATPMQTLHLNLSKKLFTRTAEEVTGRDISRLSWPMRVGIQDPLLMQISLALWQELEQPTSASKLYAQTAAQLLAVHLLQHYTATSIAVKEPTLKLSRQQVQRVTDFVLAHLSQDLSLEALAEQAGFSAYHFARLFRQTTGESPHRFVLRQRVEKAQQLLKETDAPLVHVALECGFANQSHLTRAFKDNFGLTPRAYRQRT